MVQTPNSQPSELTTPLIPQAQPQEDGLTNDGLIPQIFSSVPALSDAASYLSQTTSYLAGCFSDYSGKLCDFSSYFSRVYFE
ncbi:hypothetical protein MtrunA17_Chr8g0334781 [Medicago truncatula]|uniref:Uncharacterized protein n=1 Tax=Medicago truncatula TaxID=3880 RepID=A0A396GCK9_MEDTR|nr:hypothetical protein MtrunA17_Chr8g0334781 [Medicago truncatula]